MIYKKDLEKRIKNLEIEIESLNSYSVTKIEEALKNHARFIKSLIEFLGLDYEKTEDWFGVEKFIFKKIEADKVSKRNKVVKKES